MQTEFGEHTEEIFKEIKQDIAKHFFEFDYNCLTVKLFLHREDISTVDEIYKTLESIRRDIGRWHIFKNSRNAPKELDGVLENIMDKRLPAILPELLKKLETSLRRSYSLV